jgi:hypothetical protein
MVIQVIAILYCHIVYVWSYGVLLESLVPYACYSCCALSTFIYKFECKET